MQLMNIGQWRWAHGGILLSAVLSALAHPPVGLGFLILFAPSFWFAFLSVQSPKNGFVWGWIWAITYGLTAGHPLIYLVQERTGSLVIALTGWLLVVAIHALFFGLFGLFASLAPKQPLRAALWIGSFWTLCQWARGLGDFGFVWCHWSVALVSRESDILSHTLLQAADLGGGWGLEWLIAFFNGLLASLIWITTRMRMNPYSPLPKLPATPIPGSPGSLGEPTEGENSKITNHSYKHVLASLIILLFLWSGYGIWRLQTISLSENENEARLATVIQPNLNLTEAVPPWKWEPIRERTLQLTDSAAQAKPDLIFLPESIEPSALPGNRAVMERWSQIAKDHDCMILIGAPRQNLLGDKQMANGAFLFLPNGNHQAHEKVKLVPLGEHVPYRQWMPFLTLFGVVEEDLRPGQSLKPLPGRRNEQIGVVICMESTYPWIARHLTANGANLLAVISNESWFGRTAALEQHAAFTALRAVENRRWIARAAPQGISGFYSPYGNAVTLPKFIEQSANQRIYLSERQTLYVRFGEWILFMSIGLIVLLRFLPSKKHPHIRE